MIDELRKRIEAEEELEEKALREAHDHAANIREAKRLLDKALREVKNPEKKIRLRVEFGDWPHSLPRTASDLVVSADISETRQINRARECCKPRGRLLTVNTHSVTFMQELRNLLRLGELDRRGVDVSSLRGVPAKVYWICAHEVEIYENGTPVEIDEFGDFFLPQQAKELQEQDNLATDLFNLIDRLGD